MAIEIKKDTAVIVCNALVALGVLALVALKFIDWKMAIGALALLLTPSIAGAQRDSNERTRDTDKPPPVLPLIAIMTVALGAGCFPVDKTIQADVGYKLQQGACIDRNDTREAIDACRDRVKAAWSKDAGAKGAAVDAAVVADAAPVATPDASIADAATSDDGGDR